MEENKKNLSEELLSQVSGGVDVSMYSEEDLAAIFDYHFQKYGQIDALPYLETWGVTTGDYYLMSRRKYWEDTPYYDASDGWKLAHLIYQRNH